MDSNDARPVFYLIGVSTGNASVRSIFPGWMTSLGLDARLEGIDLPEQAESKRYRDAIETIRRDEAALGAMVSTHKSDVYRICADLLDELDPLAVMLGEVSCIVKRDGRLIGKAQDPQAIAAAMNMFMMPDHWQRHRSDLLCIGAGGTGLAACYVAITRMPETDRPARIVIADIDTGRLETLGHQIDRLKPDMPIQYHRIHRPTDCDTLVSSLRPWSLIVNSTGLGREQPGSPVSDRVAFPDRSLIWELDYRGEPQFLAKARRHAESRSLRIEDGWQYFVHFWSMGIADVFDIEIEEEKRLELARIAAKN